MMSIDYLSFFTTPNDTNNTFGLGNLNIWLAFKTIFDTTAIYI